MTDVILVLHKLQRLKAQVALTRSRRPATAAVMSEDAVLREPRRSRNRIAHGYASVDQERLWRELPIGLQALETFAAAVAAWLPEP